MADPSNVPLLAEGRRQSGAALFPAICLPPTAYCHCFLPSATFSSGITVGSANHYHSSRLIGRIHQPIHTFFSNARRPTKGTRKSIFRLAIYLVLFACIGRRHSVPQSTSKKGKTL